MVTQRFILHAALCAMLPACSGFAPGGRPQFTAPPAVSSVYSSIDMDVRLAVAAPAKPDCAAVACPGDRSFDQQVARIGGRLARSAYAAYPRLRQRVAAFSFDVADKAEPGSASDARGKVVIFRGVRRSNPDEKALAFMLAREMGHVIARHHDEKSATGILMSVLVQLFMPFTSLTGGLATLTGSTASVVGSEIVSAQSDAERTREADVIAYELLKRQGWTQAQLLASFAGCARTLGDDNWSQALKQSLEGVAKNRRGKGAASSA